MSEYTPVLIAVLFVVVAFIVASSKGVVGMLASGLATAVGLVILLAGFQYLPGLTERYLGVEATWKFSLGVSAAVAFVAFLVLRIALSLVLKKLFNPDSWLHPFVDGTAGGVLSLLPSLVSVLVFFTCVRAAGTVQELNYIDSLAREGIREMGDSIPSYPLTATWRNAIERLPFAEFLDLTDPFSRRPERNAAAYLLARDGGALWNHLRSHETTGQLADSPLWAELPAQPDVAEALKSLDRVALVTSKSLREAVATQDLRGPLGNIDFEEALRSFLQSLAPPSTTAPEPVPAVQS